jgi:hypothetical protein
MGWFVGGPWNEPAMLHPGDAVDSSALIVLLPRRDMAVVVLVNASNELIVPGNPAAISRMERNAVDVLIGAPVETGASVRRFYAIFDGVVALLLAGALVALFRALRDARRRRVPRHRIRAWAAVLARAAATALLLGYPMLTGYGWAAMRAWHLDLALALALVGGVMLAATVARVVWLWRTRAGAARPRPSLPAEELPAPTPPVEAFAGSSR